MNDSIRFLFCLGQNICTGPICLMPASRLAGVCLPNNKGRKRRYDENQQQKQMSTPLSYATRVQIVRLRKKGQSYAQIAKKLSCSTKSVQRIWSQYQAKGEKGLQTNYHKSGRRSPYDSTIWEQIAQIRDSEQGAPYVRSILLERHPHALVPHERTIQRQWARQGHHRPRGRPKKPSTWSTEAGHTFQIDGKDHISLKSGTSVSWMKVADEASGTDLSTQLFSL